MSDGEICLANPNQPRHSQGAASFYYALPAASPQEGASLLETIGAGGSVGSGAQLWRTGVTMPLIRAQYEREIELLVKEVERRKSMGQSSREIAEWVVRERRQLANRMRWRSGPGTRVLFEVRDWTEYGVGGRSFNNIEARYSARGLRGNALNERMFKGATSSNTGISNTAIKGARYLKHSGRVVLVLSLAVTAHTLLTAPKEDLERLFYEEAGGMAGGSAGAGLGVGACLVFGIASGGWGLREVAA